MNNTAVKKIGIITGSGPDAGIDMWQKILRHNKQKFADTYRGDLDAPYVSIISEPQLGLSMELACNHEQVWQTLKQTIEKISPLCDRFVIACNTLNYYQSAIEHAGYGQQFLSFTTVLEQYIERQQLTQVALLGAKSVMDFGAWSPYRDLTSHIEFEAIPQIAIMQDLIYAVKQYGAGAKQRQQLADFIDNLASDTIFLACTELPLIADIATDKSLIDVTDLVAQYLVGKDD